ncbi:FxsA family protein [Lentibacillus saliphilus]|uniref:FxsA family protein n=1 Tax=Lentibacillus saliphilus TaxID=2737028 RepID=UPI001C2FC324|nr:FxsA family protein [Lentibacillus saliphilus]
MRFIILALLIIPAIEIGVFIWAGGIIGPWWIVGLILLTGFVGISIAKQQGTDTWHRAQQSMMNGQTPAVEIIDGICIFAGAVFLLTPGFLTDIVGFVLVLPITRTPLNNIIQRYVQKLLNKGVIIYRK